MKKLLTNKTPIILAGVMLVFYILSIKSYEFGVLVHNIIDIFAGGRSFIKVSLFFVFTIFLCSISFLSNLWKKVPKISNPWLLGSISFAYLYNIATLFLFFNKLGLPFKSFAIIFHNNEISSTTLLHNHVMKGINALLLQPLGLANGENIDAGLAYLGWLPSIVFIIGGILVLISAALLVLKFIELYKTQEKHRGKWAWLFILIYSIISFSILKNLLDGGPFNREVPVAISALIYLIYHSEIKNSIKLAAITFTPFILFIFSAIINFVFFQTYIFQIISFTLLMTTGIYWLITQKVKRLGVLLIILLSTFMYYPFADTYNTYINSNKLISNDGVYVGLLREPTNNLKTQTNWEQVDKVNDLNIYKVTTSQPVKLKELIESENLMSNLGPITIPWDNCLPESPNQKVSFTVKTSQNIVNQNITHVFGNIIKIDSVNTDSSNNTEGFREYKVLASLHPCAPRVLNLVDQLLRERGLSDFIILNISDQHAAI